MPLSLFDPYVFVDRVILPERLQQLLGTIDSNILLGYLGTDVATGIDLNVTDFMAGRIAIELGAVSLPVPFGFNASNSSDSSTPSRNSSNGSQSRVLPAYTKPAALIEQLRATGRLDVCMLGVFVRYVELVPPTEVSQACAASWSWLEHADSLRVKLAEHAACGTDFQAEQQLEHLHSHTVRLTALAPSRWIQTCLQSYDFMDGMYQSAILPTRSLRRVLFSVERLLGGLESIWEGERLGDVDQRDTVPDELSPLLAQATSELRELSRWRPRAQMAIQTLLGASGVLAVDTELNPANAVAELQLITNALHTTSERLPVDGLPDVAYELKMLQIQMHDLLPYVDRLAASLRDAAARISRVLEKVAEALTKLEQIDPKPGIDALASALPIEDVDFVVVNRFLARARAFYEELPSFVSRLPLSQARLRSRNCPTRELGCLVQPALMQLRQLQEYYALRPDSVWKNLETLPEVAKAESESLLEDDFADIAVNASKCAGKVARMASNVPAYLRAAMHEIEGPIRQAELIAFELADHLRGFMSTSNTALRTMLNLRSMQNLTDTLLAAGRSFTYPEYTALVTAVKRLGSYMEFFQERTSPDELIWFVDNFRSFVMPASDQIDKMASLFEAKALLDYFQGVPRFLIAKLTQFEHIPTQRMADALPDLTDLSGASDAVYDAVDELHQQMGALLRADSSCLSEVECQASVQLRVRQMKTNIRELRRQLLPAANFVDNVKSSLLSRLETEELARSLLPEIEVLGGWVRATTGLSLHAPSSNATSLVQQLNRAVCNEIAMYAAQGRRQPPNLQFYLNDTLTLTCALHAEQVETEQNPLTFGLTVAAESSGLFGRFNKALQRLAVSLDKSAAGVSDAIEESLDISSVLVPKANALTSDFFAVVEGFNNTRTLHQEMSNMVFLEPLAKQLSDRLSSIATTAEMDTTEAATRASLSYDQVAASSSFLCRDRPFSCEDLDIFVTKSDESHAELVDDLKLAPNQVPSSLLTGMGNDLCSSRAGLPLLARVLNKNEYMKPLITNVCPSSHCTHRASLAFHSRRGTSAYTLLCPIALSISLPCLCHYPVRPARAARSILTATLIAIAFSTDPYLAPGPSSPEARLGDSAVLDRRQVLPDGNSGHPRVPGGTEPPSHPPLRMDT